MPKEKKIEKEIAKYLESTGGVVECMQGGTIMSKKGPRTYKITLNSEGCPDIVFFYKKKYYGIEVKKNQEEVDEWLKIYDRYYGLGKALPKPYRDKKGKLTRTYKREIGQIEYAEKIEKNGGQFLVTCNLEEVKEFIK